MRVGVHPSLGAGSSLHRLAAAGCMVDVLTCLSVLSACLLGYACSPLQQAVCGVQWLLHRWLCVQPPHRGDQGVPHKGAARPVRWVCRAAACIWWLLCAAAGSCLVACLQAWLWACICSVCLPPAAGAQEYCDARILSSCVCCSCVSVLPLCMHVCSSSRQADSSAGAASAWR